MNKYSDCQCGNQSVFDFPSDSQDPIIKYFLKIAKKLGIKGYHFCITCRNRIDREFFKRYFYCESCKKHLRNKYYTKHQTTKTHLKKRKKWEKDHRGYFVSGNKMLNIINKHLDS